MHVTTHILVILFICLDFVSCVTLYARVLTQSVGLLSYTFLTSTGGDDVVVPMVNLKR